MNCPSFRKSSHGTVLASRQTQLHRHRTCAGLGSLPTAPRRLGPARPRTGCSPLPTLLTFPFPEPRHPGFPSGNTACCVLEDGAGVCSSSPLRPGARLPVSLQGALACAHDGSRLGGWRARGSCPGTKRDRCLTAAKLHFLLRNAEFCSLLKKN